MSEAKLQGRRLPKVFSSLRSFRRPCSGRMGPVPYFCGVEKVLASAWGDVVEEKAGNAYGAAYCAQEDCVCFFGRGEGVVCEWGAGGVDRGLALLLAGSDGWEPCESATDPAQQMFLKVKFDVWSFFLYYPQDLIC